MERPNSEQLAAIVAGIAEQYRVEPSRAVRLARSTARIMRAVFDDENGAAVYDVLAERANSSSHVEAVPDRADLKMALRMFDAAVQSQD